MGSTATLIAIAYAALAIIGVAVFLVVFRSTRVGFHVRTASRQALERREGLWGVAVVAFLVILLAGTIGSIPYFNQDTSAAQQKLQITGRQFAWTVNPPRVRANVKTEVDLDAADVNHAVGIYNPNDTLVRQVNVLPGVTQKFTITFSQPGTYELRCLEFCGVDHHLMENKLQVTP
jgi:cytochrome c oxidase subunit II